MGGKMERLSDTSCCRITRMSTQVKSVQFGILSPTDILKRSVVEVITDKTYQGNQPVPGGVFDARMGVVESGKVCPTCKHTNLQCQGHFGHIRLSRPAYLYQFLDYIQHILGCVCLNCSRFYLETSMPLEEITTALADLSGLDKLKLLRTMTADYKKSLRSKKTEPSLCQCGTEMFQSIQKVEGKVMTLQGMLFPAGRPCNPEKDKGDIPTPIYPEMVLRAFQRLTDEHVRLLGLDPTFSHPAWMVCTVLAVPPLTVRPSVVMEDNQRMEDDLTHQLIMIVRVNQSLREKIDKGEAQDTIEKYSELLEFFIATYVDNDIKGLPPAAQRSGRPLKTLKSRMGGKTGRARGNLMGKRVDFSARSVITPDANIDVDELGVPEEIATNLTKPEIVTVYNRDRLQQYVRNGPARHPGAKSVYLKEEKRTISLRYVNPDMIDLREGDIVHRHLIDGDRVLFNRQPSLHKASMECHRVRVLPYSTFRLNVSATKPYNAD